MSERDYLPPQGVSSSPDHLLAARESTRGARAPFEVSQEPVYPGGGGEEYPMGSYSPAPDYEHLGDLPPSYGSQSVYLVAFDPRQLFAYWDVDPGNAHLSGYGLRICRADGEVEAEVPINPREAGRYLPTGVPGGTYYVELGTTGRAGRWRPVAFSGRVTMPASGLAGEVEPKFATLPFHLSFQRLLELIQDAMGQGENLSAALARLQAGDRPGINALVGTLRNLSREQYETLERLLGHQVNLRGNTGGSLGGSSENFVLAARAGGSEMLSSGSFGQETLSSAAFGSEALTSGSLAFNSESITSFGWNASSSEAILRGLGINSEAWSLASGAFGSEALSSDRTSAFFRGLEGNLAGLTNMFSSAFANLSSDFLNSESNSSASGSF